MRLRVKSIAVLLRDVNGDPPLLQPSLETAEIQFPVAEKQRWLAGRGYDGRVIRVEPATRGKR